MPELTQSRTQTQTQTPARGASSGPTGATTTGPEQAPPKPALSPGKRYIVKAEDDQGYESATWTKIAKDHGMLDKHLVAFNQHVGSVNQGISEFGLPPVPKLQAGVEIYIPSAQELLFAECSHRADGDIVKATALFNGIAQSPNLKILETARQRASGQLGVGYGTPGDNGVFYTENPALAGASEKRTTTIDGRKQYRVNWGADFWKCSVFLHDVVYSAGYKPDLTDNKHYRLAGHLQWSTAYREVPVDKARPGHGWQRFGGTRSDESHNAILSSFVQVKDLGDGTEQWTFSIIGAESDRAAESERSHVVKKGTNETVDGKKIRFFEPKSKR